MILAFWSFGGGNSQCVYHFSSHFNFNFSTSKKFDERSNSTCCQRSNPGTIGKFVCNHNWYMVPQYNTSATASYKLYNDSALVANTTGGGGGIWIN